MGRDGEAERALSVLMRPVHADKGLCLWLDQTRLAMRRSVGAVAGWSSHSVSLFEIAGEARMVSSMESIPRARVL